jgi:hypothetical protein
MILSDDELYSPEERHKTKKDRTYPLDEGGLRMVKAVLLSGEGSV